MKRFNYIALSGITLLLTALSITSCTDKNEWDTDSSYDRLFSIPKLSIAADATEAELTWIKTPLTEYHIIELSKDTLYDAIEMGSTSSSIVYGEDKSITKSPFTLSDLDGDTKYFVRIKCVSTEKAESKWSYPEAFNFKTKAEQILQKTLIGDTYVTPEWTAGIEVTHIEILKGDVIAKKVNLSSTEIEEGTIKIEGLNPSTKYTLNIYNNDLRRGFITFTTFPSVPKADKIVYMTATDSLNQTLFDELATEGYKTVTIALPGNATYYNKNKITLPNEMSFTFFGLPGENKAIIGVQQFDFNIKHDFIKFENVELSGYIIDGEGKKTQSNYLFNQSAETAIELLEFNNCHIHDFINTPLRLQTAATKVINSIVVDNCIIHGPTGITYSILHIEGSSKIENISFTRSTIWRSGKSFILCKNINLNSITIKDCTFSKVPGNENYLIDCSSTSYGPNILTIENCILGSIGGTKAKGNRSKATPDIINSYNTNDWFTEGNNISNLFQYEGKETNLFTDPEKGDFTIKDSSFEGRKSTGDPRWYYQD